MSMFNTWVALTGTALDKANPMLLQLQQLNDSCITLKNNDMKITDLQFSFIFDQSITQILLNSCLNYFGNQCSKEPFPTNDPGMDPK